MRESLDDEVTLPLNSSAAPSETAQEYNWRSKSASRPPHESISRKTLCLRFAILYLLASGVFTLVSLVTIVRGVWQDYAWRIKPETDYIRYQGNESAIDQSKLVKSFFGPSPSVETFDVGLMLWSRFGSPDYNPAMNRTTLEPWQPLHQEIVQRGVRYDAKPVSSTTHVTIPADIV
jgi:hypothetical protein